MSFSKLPSIIKIILIKIIDEIERRIQEKNENKNETSFASSVYTSLKFIVLDQVDNIIDESVTYLKKQLDEFSLILAHKISIILASLVFVLLVFALFLFALIFAFIALAFFLGDQFNSNAIGFLLTALIIGLFFFMVVLIGRDWISTKIRSYITYKL